MTDHVLTGLEDGVLTIALNRPDKKNAITDAMYASMADALCEGAVDSDVRVVLLRAEGESFSAGNDIGDFAMIAMSGRPAEEMAVFRVLKALAHFEKPVVASVKGVAVGIGTTALLHCDLVYMAEDARLSAPFVNLALVPEAASSLLLPARIGHVRAYEMFALGRAVDGVTAAAWGLANAALPADDVDQAAAEAARALAARPAGALSATKRLMRDGAAIWAHMQVESRVFGERLMSAEAREAFTAFAERRAPDFSKV